jgi:hypothetical protein
MSESLADSAPVVVPLEEYSEIRVMMMKKAPLWPSVCLGVTVAGGPCLAASLQGFLLDPCWCEDLHAHQELPTPPAATLS